MPRKAGSRPPSSRIPSFGALAPAFRAVAPGPGCLGPGPLCGGHVRKSLVRRRPEQPRPQRRGPHHGRGGGVGHHGRALYGRDNRQRRDGRGGGQEGRRIGRCRIGGCRAAGRSGRIRFGRGCRSGCRGSGSPTAIGSRTPGPGVFGAFGSGRAGRRFGEGRSGGGRRRAPGRPARTAPRRDDAAARGRPARRFRGRRLLGARLGCRPWLAAPCAGDRRL